MRAAPASIDTMLGTTQLSLARCCKLILRDGTELGFTDHDAPLTIPMFNDFYDPIVYQAGYGLIVGDIDLAIGLDGDNTEASFPIGELISRADLISRRFHMADVFIFDVDWTQHTPEPFPMMAGYVAEARPERNMAVLEIRSQADRWNTVIGSVLSPRCRADFADHWCGATATNYQAEVFEVASNMRFKVSLAGGIIKGDDFFRFGEVEFISGDLAGTWPYEVVAYDAYEGEIEVLSPMPGFPSPGDQLLIRDGCSRLKESDDPTIPTCVTHNNVPRFRGQDQVPGTDRYLRVPVPGAGNQ
jgi:uncharacterized phage protein (TIGR02218 family)